MPKPWHPERVEKENQVQPILTEINLLTVRFDHQFDHQFDHPFGHQFDHHLVIYLAINLAINLTII